MNSFSTGTQNSRPCRNVASCRGRSRFATLFPGRTIVIMGVSLGVNHGDIGAVGRTSTSPRMPAGANPSRISVDVETDRSAPMSPGAGAQGRAAGGRSGPVKFMLLIWSNPANWDELSASRQRELAGDADAEHAALDEVLLRSGELVISAALADPVTTRVVRVRDGAVVSTDGPYA